MEEVYISDKRLNDFNVVKVETTYLFVYGTLRRGFLSPMHETIAGDTAWVGLSRIKGELYDIGKYPGAVPVKAENYITGEIIQLKEPGKVLQLLDCYEGYDVVNEKASEYCRKKEWVELTTDNRIQAWIYWYNFPVNDKQKIPGNDYLKYLQIK